MSIDEAFSRILDSGGLATLCPVAGGTPARRRRAGAVPARLEWNRIHQRQYFEHPPLEECPEIIQAYNHLCQRVQSERLARDSILVTSCARGEGKTTTALHLALRLAKQARPGETGRILLLDLDFRHPGVDVALGLGAEHDFIDILQERCTPEEALVYSESDRLYALAAREHSQEELALFRSDQTAELLQQFHANFDFIVVDSPACLEVPDAVIVGSHCSGVVLVVQQARTTREEIANALQMLLDYNTPVAGMLLNFAK